MSAPVKFCDRSAKYAKSTSSARCKVFPSVWKMASRAVRSGSGHSTRRSIRPDRSKAPSSSSGREVAAITMTPCNPSTPSSSVSSWLTTRSVTPVESWPRLKYFSFYFWLQFYTKCILLWRQTIKFIEEKNTWSGALRSVEQVAHILLTLSDVFGQ